MYIMKTLLRLLAILVIVSTVSCAKKPGYTIDIPKKYKGWIYVLKSKEIKAAAVYSPNKMGIVYVPSTIFVSENFSVSVNGKPSEGGLDLYEEKDSYATDGKTLQYIKFYYPFNNGKEKELNYYIGDDQVSLFAAIYSTHFIDKNKILLE